MPFLAKSKITLQAPAKVNLTLKVLGRRSDGYHNLRMEMVKIDLFDEIEFEVGGREIRVESDNPHLPVDPSNLIWRAADRVREVSGKRFGLAARLQKRIPVAAGLGGGSSDAAATLRALNEMLDLHWDQKTLQGLGLQLGADVPFFLAEGPQLAEGVGERLTPLKGLPPLWMVLINPGFPVATKDVYRWYDEEYPQLTDKKIDATRLSLENDLEEVVIPRYPVLGRLKELLKEAGALGTLMSGSGPTVFGLFDSAGARDRGYETVHCKKDPRWWVCQACSM